MKWKKDRLYLDGILDFKKKVLFCWVGDLGWKFTKKNQLNLKEKDCKLQKTHKKKL